MVRVAVIDRGVDATYHRLKNCAIEEIAIGKEVSKGNKRVSESRKKDAHGTSIASIIHHVAPEASILSVKLISDHFIHVDLLSQALSYCAQQDNVHIINISLGILSSSPSKRLLESCRACYQANKIIVAAAHTNTERECFPAAFPEVYGVGIGVIDDISSYGYVGDGYINVLAKGIHQRVLGEKNNPVIRSGTSYATAAFTGIAAKLQSDQGMLSHEEFHRAVERNARQVPSLHYSCINKEGNVRCHYSSTPPPVGTEKWIAFPLDDVSVLRVAKKYECAEFMMHYPISAEESFKKINNPSKRYINAFLSKKVFKHTNTLLLGNFLNNQHLINIYFGYALIDFFVKYSANFIVLDDCIGDIINERINAGRIGYAGKIKFLPAELSDDNG